ncbi:complex I intermediate-associated protein 30, mitochondrial-like [Mercenaria mercenaria]|uniref:complex I intermediate-associated protein 30, mitochondrial-like n=1 Tax=Mercenaria mercenaria TaxID=6596 RepID=UPI00234F73F8|nr:complex I intermediate-associated protein 30, mitochondrial-like [Mercenaria mercenaria]XP_045187118.2 complex I intermediate-associated protein 30, mitochondrial-like [Mercenaria mercenaria]XP_045187119.2 complex I intermediate-associated protein 30, mitochondrial-like [Mercenaria mercenaria]XP_045187120.2 complex I intermediate-associated protein 30, mitochondrial-like [Mercenaria mercenaria]XP_045187121.2 complex I intermediate-associated protein 30, mitochondrial-like [Mercenaria mercena
MTSQIFYRPVSGHKSLWNLIRQLDFHYSSVRKYCFCSLQNCSQIRVLSPENRNISILQKRYKQTEQSDIGLYFPQKEKLPRKGSVIKEISDGLEIIKAGIPQYKQEWLEKFYSDLPVGAEHGDFEYFQRFNGKDSLKDWLVSTDQDTDQGKSSATFTASPAGSALFQGYINTDVPKDGITKRAGYCNLRSPYNKLAFERQVPYDWSRYTHMYLRVRGDGRNYMLLIQMDRFFDVQTHDMYNFPLYTRGGPYWQTVKVPFSSFFLANRGRAQDQQKPFSLDKIKNFGLSVGDGVKGPFRLEIDYIALVRDELADNRQDFKYELYTKKMWET